jgi:hypothetical protein
MPASFVRAPIYTLADRSTNIPLLDRDPSFDAFHDDPRFTDLVARIGAKKRKDLTSD